jgi:hypothetical protein
MQSNQNLGTLLNKKHSLRQLSKDRTFETGKLSEWTPGVDVYIGLRKRRYYHAWCIGVLRASMNMDL